jgi:hypothetical protein
MEEFKMNKLMGIGKVQNGRVMFTTVDGNGFSRPAAKPVVEVKEEVVVAPVIKKEETLDVPSFMKNRAARPVAYVEYGTVIEVDFRKDDDEYMELPVGAFIKAVEKTLTAVESGAKLVGNPLKRFFVDGDNVKDILKGVRK